MNLEVCREVGDEMEAFVVANPGLDCIEYYDRYKEVFSRHEATSKESDGFDALSLEDQLDHYAGYAFYVGGCVAMAVLGEMVSKGNDEKDK